MAQNLPPGTVAGRVNPPIGNRYVAPSEQPASVAREGLPPGERPRMVNAQLFELEYDLGAARPSDISQVELWGTRDGGRTWHSHALDNDNRSPILVTVDREGVYGFKVVARGNAGSPNSPPRPGELPDIFIGVDLTKPSARISGVTQDPSSGTLVISWQAGDKMLAARPVSLSFGTSPAGPWTPIASGLANTGRYSWPVDRRIPDEIYLRLEVRDEAGNVGVFETGNPVIIDRPAAAAPARTRDVMPSAHIRDVRPLGRSARKTPKRYYFR